MKDPSATARTQEYLKLKLYYEKTRCSFEMNLQRVYLPDRFLNDVIFTMYNTIEAKNIPKLITPIPIPNQLPITKEMTNTSKEKISVTCIALTALVLKT